MRPDFTAAHRRAIAEGNYFIAYLLELDDPKAPVAVWTGVGSLDHGGKTYLGAGELLDIEITELSFEIQLQQIRILVSGAAQHEAELIANNDVKGMAGRLFLAFVDENRRVIGNLINVQTFEAENLVTELSDNIATLTIEGRSGVGNLVFPTRIVWTPESQNRFLKDLNQDTDDTGFDAVFSVLNASPTWAPGRYQGPTTRQDARIAVASNVVDRILQLLEDLNNAQESELDT